jgi:uncharacterized protein YeaO (DUF488 family)
VFRQARVEDIGNRRITKTHGQIVVVTQYYPRFLKRSLIHEYQHGLTPTRELLKDFKDAEKSAIERLGKDKISEAHNQAFDDVGYEDKFTLTPDAISELGRLAEIAKTGDVYLVCHCKIGDRCHREILMLYAEVNFESKISKISYPWIKIRERIADGSIVR